MSATAARRKPYLKDESVMTPGQVADLLGVSVRMARYWFDRGILAGWRIPGAKDRRFRRAEVVRFARRHRVGTVPPLAAIVGSPPAVASTVAAALAGRVEVRAVAADDGFGLAVAAHDGAAAALVGTASGPAAASRIARELAGLGVRVLAYGPCEPEEGAPAEYLGPGPSPAALAVALAAAATQPPPKPAPTAHAPGEIGEPDGPAADERDEVTRRLEAVRALRAEVRASGRPWTNAEYHARLDERLGDTAGVTVGRRAGARKGA